MSDDLYSQRSAKSFNWPLFMRFLVFFVVAGFLFVLFFWITFLNVNAPQVVLESSVVIYENGKVSDTEFAVGEFDVESQYFEVYFDEIDLLRFEAGSSFEVISIEESEGFYQISLDLEEGGVWVANMGGVLDLRLMSGDFMFQNVDGYYYVEAFGTDVFAYSYKHPVRIHFLDDEVNSLNSYLVPEGYYVEFDKDSVEDVVADLRYAKLIKEYPFYSLSDDQWKSFWSDYITNDDSRYRGILSDFESIVRRDYDAGYEEGSLAASIHDFVMNLRDLLTFSESRGADWLESDTLKYLNQALYLSVRGEELEALERLQMLPTGTVSSEEYRAYLSYLNVVLNSSVYGDDLYPVKSYLRELLWGGSDEGNLVILRDRLNEMYDLVSDGEVALAKEAFSEYERGWWDFLGMSVSDLTVFRRDISEERELLSVLLTNEDGFYVSEYFDLLENFEQAVFRVAISGVDLDEERQAFISSKIKVVNKIEDLVEERGITIDNATDVLILLLENAEILLDEITSEAAVLSYYEEQIDEGWLIVQFINSVEYTSLGGTFQERFDEFLEKEQDVDDLKAYLQSLHLGAGEETSLTLSEAKDVVYGDLDALGVSYSAIVSVGDSAYRLFEIQGGEIGGKAFEAKYDRDSKLIYDLVVGDSRFTTGVHLENLEAVVLGLDIVEEIEVEVGEQDEEGRILSYSEKLAISLLVEYLAEYGIVITEDNVVSWDLDSDFFYVEGVLIGESSVDFAVWTDEDVITGVSVDGEEVEGEFKVDEFLGSF